jgi:hypothetical protein
VTDEEKNDRLESLGGVLEDAKHAAEELHDLLKSPAKRLKIRRCTTKIIKKKKEAEED